MKNASRVIVTTFLFLAALQASAQKTSVDWDHNITDFAQYKTYAWSKPLRPTQNPLMDQRIVAAVDTQLAAKGLRKVETAADSLGDLQRRCPEGNVSDRNRIWGMANGWRHGTD